MATLAQIYDRFTPARGVAEAAPELGYQEHDVFRLRMFPNEHVYLHVKKIDHSHVVREADPKTRRMCWRVFGASCAVAVFLTGLLLPGVYGLLAGYQIEALRVQRQALERDRAALDLEETRLLSPARLEELARMQQFVDGSPQKVIYLEGKPEGTLAKR